MLPAIVSIFIGNFLIGVVFKPAYDRLRSIRERILSVTVPAPVNDVFARMLLDEENPPERRRQQLKSAVRELNAILRQYQLEYASFKKIGQVFLVALILLANAAIMPLKLALWSAIAAHLASTALVIGLAIHISSEAYPSPGRLTTLDYLGMHFPNIHPNALIDLLSPGTYIVDEKHQSKLTLAADVHLTGYKFLAAITDSDQSECYYVCLGTVHKKTAVTLVITPVAYNWLVQLGPIDKQRLMALGQDIFVHLIVFLPMPAGWRDEVLRPFVGSHALYERMPDGQIGTHLGAKATCNSNCQDTHTEFRCHKGVLYEKWKIQRVDQQPGIDNVGLRRLVSVYKSDIEKCSGIRTISRWGDPRAGLSNG
jgi:hypothetical protein